jgi:hypothetical protein
MTVSVVIMGTMQPIVLSRPHYRRWTPWVWASALANLPILSAAAGYLLLVGYSVRDVVPVSALLFVSTAFASAAAVGAVHRAVLGRPEVFAALTVIPNVLAALAVAVTPTAQVTAMCGGLLAGNLLTWLLVRRTDEPAESPPDEKTTSGAEVGGLVFASAVGGAGPFALQAVTATYPAGAATLLGLFSRLGAGVIGVTVTAFINVATDWRQRSLRPLRSAVLLLSGGQLLVLSALVIMLAASGSETVETGLAATAWIFSAGSQACAGRAVGMTSRLYAFRHTAVVTGVLYVVATGGLAVAPPSALAYFAVLLVIASVANIMFSRALGWRTEWIVNALALLALAVCAAVAVA